MNYPKLSKLIFALIVISSLMVGAVNAQVLNNTQELADQNTAFLDSAGLNQNITLGQIVSFIIKVLLSFLGVIFIVLIIYAGFMWMTSAGNDEKISKAKSTMTAAIIGLTIVLSAFLITFFVIDQLLIATKGGQGLNSQF